MFVQLCNKIFKNTAGVDTSEFTKKIYSASDVDKLDADRSENVTSSLSSLKSKADKLDVD